MREFKGAFRKPTEADISFLSGHMREADRRELKRWTGVDVGWNVRNSVRQSEVAHTGVFSDGRVACIFGAARRNLLGRDAVLWMLSTTEVDSHKTEFAVGSRAGLDLVCREMEDVEEFCNFVDTEYGAARRWVEWLGGTFSLKGVRAGACGGTFAEFYYLNPHYKED